jgi:alpha-1,2-glucosyltransferase
MEPTPRPTPATERAAWMVAALALAGGTLLMLGVPARVDEVVHFRQVAHFVDGDWGYLEPNLTVWPGMHALTAAALKLAGAQSLDAARVIGLAYAVALLAAFCGLRRAVAGPAGARLATLQLLFVPILFPLLFVVYTDVAALAAVLACTWMAVRGRHLAAASLLLVAMAFRQNSIVWGLVPAWFAWQAVPAGLEAPARMRAAARVLWPYAIPVLAFVAYWLAHGSVSLSAAQADVHPDAGLHAGNVVALLACAAVLLPLHVVAGVRAFVAAARADRRWWLLPVAVLGAALALFEVDHPFNLVFPEFFLHNRVLAWTQAGWAGKLAFAALAATGACALARTRLHGPRPGVPLVAATLLALASAWLIEPRYFLVPFALWQAFRVVDDAPAERLTLLAWAALSAWLLLGVAAQRLFL